MIKLVARILKDILKEEKINLKKEEIKDIIEIPPSLEMGDYAFPCFILAKKLKKSPIQIAKDLKERTTQNETLSALLTSAEIESVYFDPIWHRCRTR